MGLIKFARLSVREATPCRRLLKAGGVEFIEENGGAAAYDCESRRPKK